MGSEGGSRPKLWGKIRGKDAGLGARDLVRILEVCSSLCDGGRCQPAVSGAEMETQVRGPLMGPPQRAETVEELSHSFSHSANIY